MQEPHGTMLGGMVSNLEGMSSPSLSSAITSWTLVRTHRSKAFQHSLHREAKGLK